MFRGGLVRMGTKSPLNNNMDPVVNHCTESPLNMERRDLVQSLCVDHKVEYTCDSMFIIILTRKSNGRKI